MYRVYHLKVENVFHQIKSILVHSEVNKNILIKYRCLTTPIFRAYVVRRPSEAFFGVAYVVSITYFCALWACGARELGFFSMD